MARKQVVYVSSTFADLKEHRSALKTALEKAQYDVESMEKYPAFDERPLDKCLADVAHADVYVLLVAHRYGSRPKEGNPERKSITQLEYEEAGRHKGKPRLVFTVAPNHPWPPTWIDKGKDARNVAAFRREVEARHGVNQFTDSNQLASLVLQALRAQESGARGTQGEAATAQSYRWPAPWDFAPYMAEKREVFEGRDWVFADIEAWQAAAGPRALLVRADFGVGKSAIMAELVRRNPNGAVLAWHFCQYDTQETLHPGHFVRHLAAQLAAALPAYKALVEGEPALQERLDRALTDPGSAFEGAVLAPLGRLEAPGGPRLLLIDALDEALELDPETARRTGHIVSLLATRARRFPSWLRVLATARPMPEVLTPLQYAFDPKEIDAESDRNQDDLRRYILRRASHEPLTTVLKETGKRPEALAEQLVAQSEGKFLFAVRALRDLELRHIGVAELALLAPGMDSFYLDAFDRRFRRAGLHYEAARTVLGILAAAREPLPAAVVAAILDIGVADVQAVRQALPDFLRQRAGCLSFDHYSLAEWLTRETDDGFPCARAYAVDLRSSQERLRAWALEQVRAGHAQESGYLLSHLAAHLNGDDERRSTYSNLMLANFDWWPARLTQGGVEGLFADAQYLEGDPEYPLLMAVLRNSAHVLRAYPAQLPAQLLGRIGTGLGAASALGRLGTAARHWIAATGHRAQAETLLVPTSRSLRLTTASDAVLQGGGLCLAVLPDGRIASGAWDGTVRLWDPQRPHEPVVFEGHAGQVNALAVLPDGRIASGADDRTVRLWDPQHPHEPVVFEGHAGQVNALAVLPDGRIASGADDYTVRLWDPQRPHEPVVFEGHAGGVNALAVLPDGRIASGADDRTVRLWDLQRPHEPVVFEGHAGWINALAVLPDGRIASGADDRTVRVWDPQHPHEPVVFEGHAGGVNALAVLPDGRIASGEWDGTVRLWDPQRPHEPVVFEGHAGVVSTLAVLSDGRIASGAWDRTVRLWDPQRPHEPVVFEGHAGGVNALAVLPDGRIASGAWDRTVRLWDPQRPHEPAVFEGHTGGVRTLAVLPDGRIASGADDGTVRLGDPAGRLPLRDFVADASVASIATTPEGLIIAGCTDGTVHFLREALPTADETG